MANYANIKATIDANIYANGNEEITGPVLNTVLKQMVDSIGAGYQYMGVATPTSPGTNQTPDYKCFYVATTPGTYTHLGGLVVDNGESLAILKYDTSWHKDLTGAATAAQVAERVIEIPNDYDKVDMAFDLTGVMVSCPGCAIATLKVEKGQTFKIYGTLYDEGPKMGICFSEDGLSWTPLFRGTSSPQRFVLFEVDKTGYLGFTLKLPGRVNIAFVENYLFAKNAEQPVVIPDNTIPVTVINSGSADSIWWTNSSTYLAFRCSTFPKPSKSSFFSTSNESYSPTRLTGYKNGIPVKTDTNVSNFYKTDTATGKLLYVSSTFKEDIDAFAFTLQKVNGHSQEDYDSFTVLNTYCVKEQLSNISNVSDFIYEDYYPVGSLVKYRSGKIFKVVKDKSENSYAQPGGVIETELLKTDNLAIVDSMAELVAVMNELSYNIGAVSSNWKNPYGGKLYNVDGTYNRTTAEDMCRIMAYVYRYCPVVLSVMSTETAKVHIFGENDRDKTLKNNTWEKLSDAYTQIHGAGAIMPYTIIANKPGATVAVDGEGSAATGADGVSNTGFSIVVLAKIGDKLVVADAANISETNYTDGRAARAKAMIQLLDICKVILDGGSSAGMPTSYMDMGAAAVVNEEGLDFIYTKNGDSLFQPASTSKVMGAVAIISVLPGLEAYHSIWDDPLELINDSGNDDTSPETHIAKAGDVESVRTSLYACLLVSNGANTLSLARMAGERIIRSKQKFLNI